MTDHLKIVHLDDHLVAIHKPAGLLVHRSEMDRNETLFALQMTRDLLNEKVYPVHRLDKPTSGLLLFARQSETAKHLNLQFSSHQVKKTYHAICRGWLQSDGTIVRPLKYKAETKSEKNRTDPLIQDATTNFQTLEHATLKKPLNQHDSQRYSLVQLNPLTGRKHQIRRHLNAIGHPIIGDVNHGDRHHNHLFNDWLMQHRLYLAATQLQLHHPHTQAPLTINCPLEPSFESTLEQLGLTPPNSLTAFSDYHFPHLPLRAN